MLDTVRAKYGAKDACETRKELLKIRPSFPGACVGPRGNFEVRVGVDVMCKAAWNKINCWNWVLDGEEASGDDLNAKRLWAGKDSALHPRNSVSFVHRL